MSPRRIDPRLAHMLDAASRHGDESGADYEVGDLRQMMMLAWEVIAEGAGESSLDRFVQQAEAILVDWKEVG
jgi:hypothetical protein